MQGRSSLFETAFQTEFGKAYDWLANQDSNIDCLVVTGTSIDLKESTGLKYFFKLDKKTLLKRLSPDKTEKF